jgi:hypothetical protein
VVKALLRRLLGIEIGKDWQGMAKGFYEYLLRFCEESGNNRNYD